MLVRLFRISDRLGFACIKVSGWAGARLEAFARRARQRLSARFSNPDFETTSSQIEGQVRSLSGVIVVLLIGVTTLILWATSPQAQSNPVIHFLSLGSSSSSSSSNNAAPPPEARSQFRSSAGTVVFSMQAGAYENLFAISTGQSAPTRLTSGAFDDRSPAWSPDGQKIAFASHRDGNWDLYVMTLATGEIKRLTSDLVYESNPSWSPDGLWLAYEGYTSGNLDIYIIKADGSEGPYPVTRAPSAEFDPAWTTDPGGRTIAYVSNRTGDQDIYLISLDQPNEDKAIDLTNSPGVDESHPVWSPDGKYLAFEADSDGIPLVEVQQATAGSAPTVIGQGTSPAWSPDGGELAFVTTRRQGTLLLTGQYGAWDSSVSAFALPALARDLTWSAATLPNPPQGTLAFAATAPIVSAYTETLSSAQGQNAPYRLISLPGVAANSQPYLSDTVDASFSALRDSINKRAGWDFLGRLDQVWWPLDHLSAPGQPFENWHKAGRAFDVVQSYNQGNPAQVEVIPEQIGPDTYWRLFVRAAVQDGSLGEPLRAIPWDFSARTSGDVAAYEAGGRPKATIPSGYYIDFTRIASEYGWERTPSDATWRSNWPGVLYWQYQKTDNLEWWSAMLQLYPDATLRQAFSTPKPVTSQPPISTPVPTFAKPSATPSPRSGKSATATPSPVKATRTPAVGGEP